MRGLTDGGPERDALLAGFDSCKALILASDCIDYIENCNVNNGHGPAGAARPELFAKNPILAGRDWGVIQTGGIDGSLVPSMDRLGSSGALQSG